MHSGAVFYSHTRITHTHTRAPTPVKSSSVHSDGSEAVSKPGALSLVSEYLVEGRGVPGRKHRMGLGCLREPQTWELLQRCRRGGNLPPVSEDLLTHVRQMGGRERDPADTAPTTCQSCRHPCGLLRLCPNMVRSKVTSPLRSSPQHVRWCNHGKTRMKERSPKRKAGTRSRVQVMIKRKAETLSRLRKLRGHGTE